METGLAIMNNKVSVSANGKLGECRAGWFVRQRLKGGTRSFDSMLRRVQRSAAQDSQVQKRSRRVDCAGLGINCRFVAVAEVVSTLWRVSGQKRE
jgi:hypothetical protein